MPTPSNRSPVHRLGNGHTYQAHERVRRQRKSEANNTHAISECAFGAGLWRWVGGCLIDQLRRLVFRACNAANLALYYSQSCGHPFALGPCVTGVERFHTLLPSLTYRIILASLQHPLAFVICQIERYALLTRITPLHPQIRL